MHIPVYSFKGGNYTAEDFATQLAAIEDSLPDRITPLSAMDDVQELISRHDMRMVERLPQLRDPLLGLVNAIIAAHEGSHKQVGESGWVDITRMAEAQQLRDTLLRSGPHLRMFVDDAGRTGNYRKAKAASGEPEPARPNLRLFPGR